MVRKNVRTFEKCVMYQSSDAMRCDAMRLDIFKWYMTSEMLIQFRIDGTKIFFLSNAISQFKKKKHRLTHRHISISRKNLNFNSSHLRKPNIRIFYLALIRNQTTTTTTKKMFLLIDLSLTCHTQSPQQKFYQTNFDL